MRFFLNHAFQLNVFYVEEERHGSNTVSSILHNYVEVTVPMFGRDEALHRHWCAEQKKNNIGLGYFMSTVGLIFKKSIEKHFMAAGSTKFRPDEGFGHIRKYVGRPVDAF